MSIKRRRRSAGVLRALSDLFILQPSFNYEPLVSNSAQSLSDEAWLMTALQMTEAFKEIERLNPKIKEMAKAQRLSAGQESIFEQQSREFEELILSVEQQQSEFEWRRTEFGGPGSRGPVKPRILSPA